MSGTGHRRTLTVLLAVVFLLISCSSDTAVMPTTTTAAAMSTTTTAVIPTTTMTVPATVTDRSSEELVGMYEWYPENGFHNEIWSGTLVIDALCVYLDVSDQNGIAPAPQIGGTGDPLLRSLIRLPAPLTRHNAGTGELWVGGYGPMSTGDQVVLAGTRGWLLDWSADEKDGMHVFGYWRPEECPAHVSFWAASIRPAGADPKGVLQTAELPGLGLFPWDTEMGYDDAAPYPGFLGIEGPCVYYDIPGERRILHLPRPLVRFNSDSGTLWYKERSFTDGDRILVAGQDQGNEPSEYLETFLEAGCSADGEYSAVYIGNCDTEERKSSTEVVYCTEYRVLNSWFANSNETTDPTVTSESPAATGQISELAGMYPSTPVAIPRPHSAWSGRLVIDEPCVYIDVTEQDDAVSTPQSGDSLRAFIQLPESLTRYNADTGELWVIGAGPMSTGDHIVLTGRSILELHWKYHGDSGLYNFWYDDERTRACPANLAFWTASMRPSNDNP